MAKSKSRNRSVCALVSPFPRELDGKPMTPDLPGAHYIPGLGLRTRTARPCVMNPCCEAHPRKTHERDGILVKWPRRVSWVFARLLASEASAEKSLGAADTSGSPPFGQSLATLTRDETASSQRGPIANRPQDNIPMSLTLTDLQATVGRPILAAAAFQAAGRLKAGCRHECLARMPAPQEAC
jgi:hypothetical protein